MSEITQLTQIDFAYVFISICIILFAVKALISLFDWFSEKFGIETKSMRRKREEHELLVNTADGLAKTSESLVELQRQHNESVKQSIRHDKELKDELQSLRNDFHAQTQDLNQNISTMKKEIDDRLNDSKVRENERVQAELKDRIGQSYRYYHTIGKINDMELEALKDLIKSYENHGGENSFVHTVVQPEMYTWEKV